MRRLFREFNKVWPISEANIHRTVLVNLNEVKQIIRDTPGSPNRSILIFKDGKTLDVFLQWDNWGQILND